MTTSSSGICVKLANATRHALILTEFSPMSTEAVYCSNMTCSQSSNTTENPANGCNAQLTPTKNRFQPIHLQPEGSLYLQYTVCPLKDVHAASGGALLCADQKSIGTIGLNVLNFPDAPVVTVDEKGTTNGTAIIRTGSNGIYKITFTAN